MGRCVGARGWVCVGGRVWARVWVCARRPHRTLRASFCRKHTRLRVRVCVYACCTITQAHALALTRHTERSRYPLHTNTDRRRTPRAGHPSRGRPSRRAGFARARTSSAPRSAATPVWVGKGENVHAMREGWKCVRVCGCGCLRGCRCVCVYACVPVRARACARGRSRKETAREVSLQFHSSPSRHTLPHTPALRHPQEHRTHERWRRPHGTLSAAHKGGDGIG